MGWLYYGGHLPLNPHFRRLQLLNYKRFFDLLFSPLRRDLYRFNLSCSDQSASTRGNTRLAMEQSRLPACRPCSSVNLIHSQSNSASRPSR